MRRPNTPLQQKAMHLFVEAAEEFSDVVKALTCLIPIFTGVRANTLCHIHSDWFHYDEGNLYLKVPNEYPCLKYDTEELCCDCTRSTNDRYSPKSRAGGGRNLKIPETWHNHHLGDDNYPLGLRETIEHYFNVDEDDFGHAMLDGDGISTGTANRYIKQVAAEAEIGFYLKPGYLDHSKLGRVPDVMLHDLRGTFCVQLMRNDANPFKSIEKTGHEDVDSLKPYIEFAEGEFDGDFEDEFI